MEKTQDEEWDYYTCNGKKVCVATDREAAYGRTIGEIPLKKYVLCALTNHRDTDSIGSPAPQVLIVKNIKKLPVKVVVMAYLTAEYGILAQYQKGVRNICGYTLPAGLKENQKLSSLLIIPVMNNHILSKEAIFAEGLVDESIYDSMEATATELFRKGAENAEKNNLILATAQYEFGEENNTAIPLHSYHTYKTATFWDNGIKVEPVVIKNWLESVGFKGNGPAPPIPEDIKEQASQEYITLYKKLTGKELKVPKKEKDIAEFLK
jgi:phosphoribosylaminoimidazole-succinocarboxamide synthase